MANCQDFVWLSELCLRMDLFLGMLLHYSTLMIVLIQNSNCQSLTIIYAVNVKRTGLSSMEEELAVVGD